LNDHWFYRNIILIKGFLQKLRGNSEKKAPAASGSASAGSAKGSTKSGGKNQARSAKPAAATAQHDVQGRKDSQSQNKKPQSKKRQEPKKTAPAWDLSQFVVAEHPEKVRFHEFDLALPLMHAIADLGFEYSTPIQAQSLPHTLEGHDVIGKAQTGTGKTAAFLITMINDFINNPIKEERYVGEPRALIIAPTRELVQQIAKDAFGLCKHSGLNVCTLIGGMDYQKQQDQLNGALVDIVVATPGRLIDFLTRGHIHLDMVEILVVDEADRMLDMGFIPQVRRIVRATPPKTHRQTLLFSATFTPEVMSLTEQWTFEPVSIEIEPDRVATDSVEQRLYAVADHEKLKAVKNILAEDEVSSAIIFANRRDQTRRLEERLAKAGIKCGLLSGEVAQNKRTRTLEDFRSGKINVLVATDVAGRGIHIDGISHVINYTLPEDPEDYVHRIGRTGRGGATGVSISLIGEEDAFNMMPIEELLGERMSCENIPEIYLR
jgi:ATP-dependent RNA helicase RhlB